MQLGFIGLGKMGGRMASKLVKEGHDVIAWNRSEDVLEEFQRQNKKAKIAKSVKELVSSLKTPRVVWSMLPAGQATTDMLGEIAKYVEPGDIVIDGGNAHFSDTQKRYDAFIKKKIKFLGIGVSGGIIAVTEGYPIMVGGDASAYQYITTLLDSLSKPHGGHQFFGVGGAGHFVKMIHNGMEYGIMQALGEGFGVLDKAPYKFDLIKIAKLYQKGTLVSGFMLDRVVEALTKDPNLSKITGYIAESGEAVWTVDQAKKEKVVYFFVTAWPPKTFRSAATIRAAYEAWIDLFVCDLFRKSNACSIFSITTFSLGELKSDVSKKNSNKHKRCSNYCDSICSPKIIHLLISFQITPLLAKIIYQG